MLGFALSQFLGPGLGVSVVAVIACFLCFATMAVHPGAFMFFFMVLMAVGWHSLEGERLDLTFWERILGEVTGVAIAMVALTLLQWEQDHRPGVSKGPAD